MAVANAKPAGVAVSSSPAGIGENGVITLSGSFTDPGALDTHAVSIDWGDGTPTTSVPLAAHVLSFNGITHQYLDNKPGDVAYAIAVRKAEGVAFNVVPHSS